MKTKVLENNPMNFTDALHRLLKTDKCVGIKPGHNTNHIVLNDNIGSKTDFTLCWNGCPKDTQIRTEQLAGEWFLVVVNDEVKLTEEHQRQSLVLLQATLDILNKCDEGSYVKNVMETTAIWDDVECDGYCLKEEIEQLLEELNC